MTAVLRTALVAALAAASIPAVAAGQETSTASLLRRIEQLERANADLEQRVRELEAIIRKEPSRDRQLQASGNWRDISNWRQLRQGMKPDQVRALLGEPERVEGGNFTTWSWSGAYVVFYSGKLDRWSEPQ